MAVKFFNPKSAGNVAIKSAKVGMKQASLSVKKAPAMRLKVAKPKVGKSSKIKI